MAQYSESIDRLIEQFGRLPGIGERTAERLAFHLLKADESEALALAQAIADVKTRIHPCKQCFNLAEGGQLCEICRDSARNPARICVVEQPKDLLALESTGAWNGLYHVLMGQIAPLEGVEPEDLTIDELVQRVRTGTVEEVVLATNPTVGGDGTALHISSLLAGTDVKVTRLARGLPSGGQIEYSNKSILADALNERRGI
ncbi:MAG: recombination mediator RecR [Phycisphaerae bacterium]